MILNVIYGVISVFYNNDNNKKAIKSNNKNKKQTKQKQTKIKSEKQGFCCCFLRLNQHSFNPHRKGLWQSEFVGVNTKHIYKGTEMASVENSSEQKIFITRSHILTASLKRWSAIA